MKFAYLAAIVVVGCSQPDAVPKKTYYGTQPQGAGDGDTQVQRGDDTSPGSNDNPGGTPADNPGSSDPGTGGGTQPANVECQACSIDSECGDGVSAGCWLPDGNGNAAFCALDCTTDGSTCPAGSSCMSDGSAYKTCVPDAGSCDDPTDGGATGGGTTGGGTTGGGTTGGGASGGGTTDGGSSSVECLPCDSNDVCGDGVTAGCWLSDGAGAGYCALDCTDSNSCPTGSSCVQDDGDAYKTCIPDAGSCGDTVDPGTGDGGNTGGSTGGTVQCSPCTSDPTCGDGQSAGCWLPDANGNPAYCALDCTDSNSCPSGSTCVQDDGDAYKTCLPTSGSCTDTSGGTTGGTTGGDTGGTGSTCTDTWDNYAASFFSTNCLECHGWASSHAQVQAGASSISSRIQSGNMPPSGLSSTSRQRILDWLACGAN